MKIQASYQNGCEHFFHFGSLNNRVFYHNREGLFLRIPKKIISKVVIFTGVECKFSMQSCNQIRLTLDQKKISDLATSVLQNIVNLKSFHPQTTEKKVL